MTLTAVNPAHRQLLRSATAPGWSLEFLHQFDRPHQEHASSLALNGGTLTLTGTTGATDSQTFAGTTVSGGGVITLTQGGATSLTVALGAITQSTGGTLNFTIVPATSGVIATTTSANVNGILGPWATVGLLTNTLRYATVNGSNQIVAYTTRHGCCQCKQPHLYDGHRELRPRLGDRSDALFIFCEYHYL